MRTAPPVSLIEPAHATPFILPVATPLSKFQPAKSVASSIAPAPSEVASFRYFAEIGGAEDEEAPSLNREPLVNQAVHETFFALSLLESSNRSQVTASNGDETGIAAEAENANRISLVGLKQPQHQDVAVIDPAIHQNTNATIALAEEAIRNVDALVAVANAEVTDIAIAQVFNETPEVTIVLKPESNGSGRVRSTSSNQGWHLGLFGLMSIFVAARSLPSKRLNDDPAHFDKLRRKDQCSRDNLR